jgi:hypothetical protein
MDDDSDYAMAVIRYRCPEIADQVMPIEVLKRAIEVLEAIGERMTEVGERVQAMQEAHDERLRVARAG